MLVPLHQGLVVTTISLYVSKWTIAYMTRACSTDRVYLEWIATNVIVPQDIPVKTVKSTLGLHACQIHVKMVAAVKRTNVETISAIVHLISLVNHAKMK